MNNETFSNNTTSITAESLRTGGGSQLPADPLKAAIQANSGFDIRTAMAKARARSEMSRVALTEYKAAFKHAIQEQLSVIVQNESLVASAKRREIFDAYMKHTAEITQSLNNNVDRFIDSMQEHELRGLEQASVKLEQETERYSRLLQDKKLSEDKYDRLIQTLDMQFERRCKIVGERIEEFMNEMNQQVTQVVSRFKAEDEKLL